MSNERKKLAMPGYSPFVSSSKPRQKKKKNSSLLALPGLSVIGLASSLFHRLLGLETKSADLRSNKAFLGR
jgi:hypothetical protein